MVQVKMNEGEVLRNQWRVVRKLAEGGFGAVYQATDEKKKVECAIKIEAADQNSVLKIETMVLLKLRGMSRHSCGILGMGRVAGRMNFIVMTLVGPSLCDLHRARAGRKFTGSTVARLALQCITAVQDLHTVGFVHRDIKPGNFAIGRFNNDRRTVYLLDFGLARRYMNANGLRQQRENIGFRGTVRYASVNVHAGREQGRHDDLLSLLYSLTEFRLGRLPWQGEEDDDAVAEMKLEMAYVKTVGIEREFAEVHERLSRLSYADTPDYNWCRDRFVAMQKRMNYSTDGPFEWETQK